MKLYGAYLALLASSPLLALSRMVVESEQTRTPTVDDWNFVLDLIEAEIHQSTCVKDESHWDYDPEIDDCKKFPIIRNPKPLGSRLIRLAFHDAMGQSDAYLELGDPEHAGLEPAVEILDALYENNGIGEYLTRADFFAWSYHAALLVACKLQGGDDMYLPSIPVQWGRPVSVQTNSRFTPRKR